MSAASDERGVNPGRRILYGRRSARRLRAGRREAVERALPGLRIVPPPGEDAIDPIALFDEAPSELWLEVGFGAGEHLLAQAIRHPDIGFIGCEPYLNGVAMLLGGIRDHDAGNIRLFRDDARILLDHLPDSCLGRVFVLFPDPWPKTRHHKRRFISPAVLDALARSLKDGAELRVATDDGGYLAWILAHVLRHGGFEWLARCPADWRRRPDDWPATRYERKAIDAGRRPAYLRFAKRLAIRGGRTIC